MLHLWEARERVVLHAAEADETELGIPSAVKAEILRRRCENLLKADTPEETRRAQQRLDRSEGQLAQLMVVPFNELAASQLVRLSKVKRLKRIGRADLLIASVALANDATLVTRNLKHFRQVPSLKLVNWVD